MNRIIKVVFSAMLILQINLTGHCQDSFFWKKSTPEMQGMSSAKLESLKLDLQSRGTKKLLIIKNDHIVCEWFDLGWKDSERNHYSASLAKALVGGISLMVALDDGLLHPDMPACNLIEEWKKDAKKSTITIRQLATHTSGLDDAEVNRSLQEEMKAIGLDKHMDLQGWKGQFWKKEPNPFVIARDSVPLISIPGTNYNYSNPGIGMLTYGVTVSLKNTEKKDVRALLWNRVFAPIGIKNNEIDMGYGKTYEENGLALVPSWGGGGFSVNAIARIGRLLLNKGNWDGKQIISSDWVNKTTQYSNTVVSGKNSKVTNESSLRTLNNPVPAATMGWYTNFDGNFEHLPRDAFWGAGAGNQHLLVVPSLDLIVVRMGNNLSDESFWASAEKYLFNPILDAIIEPPYPKSKKIEIVKFASESEIIRLAEGSDNWPVTWAKDDNLYSAYGDGWGFEPKTDIKLSLGLARIEGIPPNIKGTNIRTNSGERVGQGKYGIKASGLLSVDGILYMLTRNQGNARLAWSENLGKTWEWTDTGFSESFGCPTFLNIGKDYLSSPDNYVYVYSTDETSAYNICDNYVLARVPKDKIRDWKSYVFFMGLDKNNNPLWTEDIRKREAVFKNPGKCYRSGISYNPGISKYMWCQIIPLGSDERGERFSGGFGIFISNNPWGPWETLYYTREYDMGPGETASIPAKWISEDGKSFYILSSSDDFFTLRKCAIEIKE
jgi:CubicO group peptidase (beta-lactamase class C family)